LKACDARGQAVHIVQEIEGVDNQDYPEGREDGRNYRVVNEEMDPDFSKSGGCKRNCKLNA